MSLDESRFEAYEEEYQSLSSQIQKELGRSRDECSPDSFHRCTMLIKKMTVEARKILDGDEQEELKSRIGLYNIQLQALKDYRYSKDEPAATANQTHEANRQELMASASSSSSKTSTSSRPKDSLSTRIQLSEQNKTLERARRAIAATEDVAGSISNELARNRETIESSHSRVNEMAGMTNDANRILTRMKKRWFT